MLAPHHQILHLCVHLHTHGYGRLIWFKDLDLLIRQRGHEIDWPQVYALAHAEGAELSPAGSAGRRTESARDGAPPRQARAAARQSRRGIVSERECRGAVDGQSRNGAARKPALRDASYVT
jgi:hypothetical protein